MKSLTPITRWFQPAARRPHGGRRPSQVLNLEPLEDLLLLSTFTVTNTNNAGPGSLRQAILGANANPGRDVIAFRIAGSGVHTIKPTSALPAITDAVVIDGTTQPGYAGAPLIDLNGASAGPNANGLRINANDTTVKGLVINGFTSGAGVYISGHHDSLLQANFIGTNAAGTAAVPNKNGVIIMCNLINDCANHEIGGTDGGQGNVISGNSQDGIQVTGVTQPDAIIGSIDGNRIGTSADGNAAVGNGRNGITVSGSLWNGGITDNVIAANHNDGIQLAQGSARLGPIGFAIYGNTIGTNAAVTAALGNRVDSINLSGARTWANFIYNNSILFSGRDGVRVDGSVYNQILGNFLQGSAGAGIQLVNGGDQAQAAPVITSAVYDGTNLTVRGTATGPANNNLTIDVFMNYECHASGYGEGQLEVGQVSATTDSSGNASFTLVYPTTSPLSFVSATTSRDVVFTIPDGSGSIEELSGDTSPFAQCVSITYPGSPTGGAGPGRPTAELTAEPPGTSVVPALAAISPEARGPAPAAPVSADEVGLTTAKPAAAPSDAPLAYHPSTNHVTDLVFEELGAQASADGLAFAVV